MGYASRVIQRFVNSS